MRKIKKNKNSFGWLVGLCSGKEEKNPMRSDRKNNLSLLLKEPQKKCSFYVCCSIEMVIFILVHFLSRIRFGHHDVYSILCSDLLKLSRLHLFPQTFADNKGMEWTTFPSLLMQKPRLSCIFHGKCVDTAWELQPNERPCHHH